MTLQWWCSAQSDPWTWVPQAYPGIWLFVAVVLGGYLYGAFALGPGRGRPAPSPRELASFGFGWALLWITLDWPLGPLAAGYLLMAHTTQYVLISLVIVPILLYGVPDWMKRAVTKGTPGLRVFVERPVLSFLIFNAVMIGTHFPEIADALKKSQLGSMGIDLAWIFSALIFWLSVDGAFSDDRSAQGVERIFGRRMLYILGTKIVPIALGAFFVLSDYPLYSTYELAPRVVEITARDDQALAGWLVWAGTTPIVIARLATAWFAWFSLEEERLGQV